MVGISNRARWGWGGSRRESTRARGLRLSLGLSLLLLPLQGFSRDLRCGDGTCEESVCASPDVLECSDWNDGSFDGWSAAGGRYEQGGELGGLLPNAGLNGSAGWEHKIRVGNPRTMTISKNLDLGFGPIHFRTYLKFSPDYQHEMNCGLQKLFYVSAREVSGQLTARTMVGVTAARDMGGQYRDLDSSVGVIGFDYRGHVVRLPDRPEDDPVLIQPDRWYAVEVMTHYTSANVNVTKLWVDGSLQMVRENFNDTAFNGTAFNGVKDTSWFGGIDSCAQNTQTQYVYRDNHVVSRSYIGPISGEPAKPAGSAPASAFETSPEPVFPGLGAPGRPVVVD